MEPRTGPLWCTQRPPTALKHQDMQITIQPTDANYGGRCSSQFYIARWWELRITGSGSSGGLYLSIKLPRSCFDILRNLSVSLHVVFCYPSFRSLRYVCQNNHCREYLNPSAWNNLNPEGRDTTQHIDTLSSHLGRLAQPHTIQWRPNGHGGNRSLGFSSWVVWHSECSPVEHRPGLKFLAFLQFLTEINFAWAMSSSNVPAQEASSSMPFFRSVVKPGLARTIRLQRENMILSLPDI